MKRDSITASSEAKQAFAAQEYEKALALYQKSLSKMDSADGNYTTCLHNIAACFKRMGKFLEAYKSYLKVQEHAGFGHPGGALKCNKDEDNIRLCVKHIVANADIAPHEKLQLVQEEVSRSGKKLYAPSEDESKVSRDSKKPGEYKFGQTFSSHMSGSFLFAKAYVENTSDVLKDEYMKYLTDQEQSLLEVVRSAAYTM